MEQEVHGTQHKKQKVARRPSPPVTNFNPFISNVGAHTHEPTESFESPASLIPPTPQKSQKRDVHFIEQDLQSSRFFTDFEELGVIGSGSFGTVLKVRKRIDGCLYAVKRMQKTTRSVAEKHRVLKEVYALAAVCSEDDNPHIVRYFSAWEEDQRIFIQVLNQSSISTARLFFYYFSASLLNARISLFVDGALQL